MSPEEKQLARVLFKLKVHQSDGKVFEQFFIQIMSYSRPGFTSIRPYGNEGDRGNDGYEKEHGRYFQIHAPENIIPDKNIGKVAQDFDKLIKHWGEFCEVKEYFFAFNDKYHGSILKIEKTLAELKNKHQLLVANAFLAPHLEDEFINLSTDIIAQIIGGLPQLNSHTPLDYSILSEVIKHILQTPPDNYTPGKLTPPDYEEKIRFNKLNATGDILKAKHRETWQIDDYFSRNSEFTKQTLRDFLAGYYLESIQQLPDTNENGDYNDEIGDLRFAHILNNLAPTTGNNPLDRLKRDAALIIMAKFFESCDIFEEPSYAASE